MTTKTEKIAALKTKYPVLRVGSEETGYTELSAEDYEAKIAEWANNELAKEQTEADIIAAKNAAITKFEALGLTADEIAALGF